MVISPQGVAPRQGVCAAAVALIALTQLGSVGCDQEAGATATERDRPAKVARQSRRVETHVVETHRFRDSVTISANVMPKRQVKLIPRVPGLLAEVLVDEGDRVEAGQIVARLDQRDYQLGVKQARAQLAAAQANSELASVGVRSAGTARKRMASLHESKAISQSELDRVDDGFRMGLAKRSAADAQSQLARVGLEAARTKLADTILRAPYDALIVKRLMDEGELCGIMPPGIVMLLADDSEMNVIGALGELLIARIHEGMDAEVHIDALPGEPFRGTIAVVSPMVDPRTRTATVQIVVPNADGRLEMGMSAEISVDLGERQAAAVPGDALIRNGSNHDGNAAAEVFVVVDGIASRRPVRLGGRDGSLHEVLDGLVAGQRVVRSGQATLRDGQRVADVSGDRR